MRTVLPPYFTRSSILIILHLKSSNQIAKFYYSLTKNAKFLSFLCQELERRQAEELHPRLVRRRREKRRTRTLLSRLTIRNSRGLRMRLVSSFSSGISRWDYLIESCDDSSSNHHKNINHMKSDYDVFIQLFSLYQRFTSQHNSVWLLGTTTGVL